jgi:tRNA A37 threonylcarbamoyladenosine synthetase subunit TsaC/SUA5/YrdC
VDPALLAHTAAALVSASPDGPREAEPEEDGAPVLAAGPGRSKGLPSTVVDLRPLAAGETPVVLREGAVAAADVLARIAEIVGSARLGR